MSAEHSNCKGKPGSVVAHNQSLNEIMMNIKIFIYRDLHESGSTTPDCNTPMSLSTMNTDESDPISPLKEDGFEISFDDSVESSWLSSSNSSSDSFNLEDSVLSDSFPLCGDERVLSWLSDLVGSPRTGSVTSNTGSEADTLGLPASLEESCLKNSSADEPIFWPLNQKFDWTPEDMMDKFCPSPLRKKSSKTNTPASCSPSSFRSQFLSKRLDIIDDCKRRLVFNSLLKGSNAPSSRSNKNNAITKNTKKNNEGNKDTNGTKMISLASIFRKSNKKSSKIVPLDIAEKNAKTETEDFSIEMLVGLEAFSGREGINSEFTGDFRLFDDLL